MKLDLAKLPVLEAIIGFLLLAIVVTFVLAFMTTEGSSGDEAVVTATSTPDDGSTPAPGDLNVSMADNSFDPGELSVTAGETATINLTNAGQAIHNMRIAGPDGEYDSGDDAVSDPEAIRGGRAGTLEWEVPAEAGAYEFRCDFHPVEMTGEITVQ